MNILRNTIIFLLVILITISCKTQDETKAKENKVFVKVQEVKKEQLTIPIQSIGRLFSKSEIKIGFKTGGIIKEILVDEGKNVKAGQTLAKLNLSEIQAQVNQAKLGVEKAKRDFQRVRNLYEDSVATLEQFENVKTLYELTQSKLEIAHFNLKYSSIKAPTNGTILKRLAGENEIIAPGYPVFLFANNESNWILRTSIIDKDIIKLKLNDSAEIIFDAFPGKKFMAQISEIGNMADLYTGTFEIELRLEKTEFNLASGFIGKVRIFPEEKIDVFKIPIDAVVEGIGSTATIIIIKDGKSVETEVSIYALYDDCILIKNGLNQGDEIVIEGANFIDSDSDIEIIND